MRSLVVGVLTCLLAGSASASAEAVALYCSWPNDIGFIVDVDYATSQVSVKLNGLPDFRPRRTSARINEYEIRWRASPAPDGKGMAPSEFRINRLTAELTACNGGPNSLNENFCNQPMKCVPRKPIL